MNTASRAIPGVEPGALIAPLLVGALLGALVAARLETALGCVAVAALGAAGAGASRPRRPWFALLASGVGAAFLLNLFLVPGRTLFALPWNTLRATAEGLELGALLGLRLAGAAVALHGLRSAWPGERAADAAARWLAPLERLRVPVSDLRLMLGLAVRFAPLLEREARRIARVQAMRAGGPPRGTLERLERLRALVIPTLVSALERAERVALALEARHYRARPPAPAAAWHRGWTAAGLTLLGAALLWRA